MGSAYNPSTGSNAENDDWPLDANGGNRLYSPFMAGVNRLAKIGMAAGNFAGSFNPLVNATTAISGKNPDGTCASKGDRIMAGLAAAGGALGELGELGEGAWNALRRQIGCFVAGTPVQMADGSTKPIEQIRVGDLVLSRDQNAGADGKVVAARVSRTFVHEVDHTVAITLSSGERIECTDNHPFFVPGMGWTPAGSLCLGTQVTPRAGPAAASHEPVTVVRVEHLAAREGNPTSVYNFEVEGTHTYFVGEANGGEWVHNDCGLRRIGNDLWESPGGLRYGSGSNQGHRLAHVMEHLVPDPSKPLHSVFDVNGQLMSTLDEAWRMRGAGTLQGTRRVFNIPMGRVVGTNGETSIRIVVENGTSNVITAFPTF